MLNNTLKHFREIEYHQLIWTNKQLRWIIQYMLMVVFSFNVAVRMKLQCLAIIPCLENKITSQWRNVKIWYNNYVYLLVDQTKLKTVLCLGCQERHTLWWPQSLARQPAFIGH